MIILLVAWFVISALTFWAFVHFMRKIEDFTLEDLFFGIIGSIIFPVAWVLIVSLFGKKIVIFKKS